MRKLATLAAALLWVGALVLLMTYRSTQLPEAFAGLCAALVGGLLLGAYGARAGALALAASLAVAAAGLTAAWLWMGGDDGLGRAWTGVVLLPLLVLVGDRFRRRPKATGTLQRISDL